MSMQKPTTIEIVSLRAGSVRTLGRAGADAMMDRPWTTGIFKQALSTSIWLGSAGLDGDGHGDSKRHGGSEKAVHVYPSEHFRFWREALGVDGIGPGAFGENFATSGATEAGVCIGDIYEVGEALVQVSQPRRPCWRLARRWRRRDLALLMQRSGHTGWYLRVLRPGYVAPRQPLTLTERPFPEWTVVRTNELLYETAEPRTLERLADCPALAEGCRVRLVERLQGAAEDPMPRLYGPNGVP